MTHFNGFNSAGVHILGKHPDNKSCIELCKNLLKMAKDGEMISIGVVIIPKEGEFHVTGAGTEIDGLLEGTIAMHDSLISLLESEQAAKLEPAVKLDS